MRCEACGCDCADKDAEIERLKGLVRYHAEQQMEGWKRERVLKGIITEFVELGYVLDDELLQRARETAK